MIGVTADPVGFQHQKSHGKSGISRLLLDATTMRRGRVVRTIGGHRNLRARGKWQDGEAEERALSAVTSLPRPPHSRDTKIALYWPFMGGRLPQVMRQVAGVASKKGDAIAAEGRLRLKKAADIAALPQNAKHVTARRPCLSYLLAPNEPEHTRRAPRRSLLNR